MKLHVHQYPSTAQYHIEHGKRRETDGQRAYHNGFPHEHPRSTDVVVVSYGRPLYSEASWNIPVRLTAHESGGVVTRLTVQPLESDAGYFGQVTAVIDGHSCLSKDGLHLALAEYLSKNQVWGEDRYFLHWEG